MTPTPTEIESLLEQLLGVQQWLMYSRFPGQEHQAVAAAVTIKKTREALLTALLHPSMETTNG